MNISIFKAILKNIKKSSDDVNNMRGLSISNAFSQIFEELIFSVSPDLHLVNKNQFRFKKHTCCNHAILILKEIILLNTDNGKGCRIISLDAENAFDKNWKEGFFSNL